jgi:hypothetical protein
MSVVQKTFKGWRILSCDLNITSKINLTSTPGRFLCIETIKMSLKAIQERLFVSKYEDEQTLLSGMYRIMINEIVRWSIHCLREGNRTM